MRFFETYTTDWTDDSVRIIGTPSITAKRAFFHVQEIGHFKTLPGYYTERSALPSYLLIYTLSGSGRLQYGGRQYTLAPGSAMFIDCMEHHIYEPDGPAPWEFDWVHFYGATSDEYYAYYQNHAQPVLDIPGGSPLPGILRQLLEVNQATPPQMELLNSRLLLDLVTELILASLAAGPKQEDGDIPAVIRQAIEFIERHFSEPLSLDDMAAAVSFSKYHLSREFKKYTGDTPGNYLIRCRVSRAKDLLKNSDLSIGEIAEAAGMPNVNHFSAIFKKHAECSPRDFRKLWRSK